MRERRSASWRTPSVLVSGVAKWASGMVARSRCGFTNSAAAGTATWEWMSMVMLFGRVSRPGRPCARAAVGPYLFQGSNSVLLPIRYSLLAIRSLEHAEVLGNQRLVVFRLGGGAL